MNTKKSQFEYLEIKIPTHMADRIREKAKNQNLSMSKTIEISIGNFFIWCENNKEIRRMKNER